MSQLQLAPMAKNMTLLENSGIISKQEKRGISITTHILHTLIVLLIVVNNLHPYLIRFNPPVVHARSGQRMTMHVANQILASMKYNHPKFQVNVLVLGTVYTLGH